MSALPKVVSRTEEKPFEARPVVLSLLRAAEKPSGSSDTMGVMTMALCTESEPGTVVRALCRTKPLSGWTVVRRKIASKATRRTYHERHEERGQSNVIQLAAGQDGILFARADGPIVVQLVESGARGSSIEPPGNGGALGKCHGHEEAVEGKDAGDERGRSDGDSSLPLVTAVDEEEDDQGQEEGADGSDQAEEAVARKCGGDAWPKHLRIKGADVAVLKGVHGLGGRGRVGKGKWGRRCRCRCLDIITLMLGNEDVELIVLF